MPVYGVDRDLVPECERLVIATLRLELDSLGCEVTSVGREACCVGRWQVRWRVKDDRIRHVSYGATGDTAVAAVRAALSNAQSDLSELRLAGGGALVGRLADVAGIRGGWLAYLRGGTR